MEPSGELDLQSFLHDFVIEMGPLDPEARGGGNGGEEIELLAPNNAGTVDSPPAA